MLGGANMSKGETLVEGMRSPEMPTSPDNPAGGGSHGDRCEPSRLPKLTPAQYRILGVIAAAGGIPISKSDIAEAAGCVVRTADRALQRLRAEGLVELVVNYDEAGGQMANSYHLHTQKEDNFQVRIRPDP